MMKKILFLLLLFCIVSSYASNDILQIEMNKERYTYPNIKMKAFLNQNYILNEECTYFRTVSLDSALIQLCDFDVTKEALHLQVTLSDAPFYHNNLENKNIFKTILTWEDTALYSFTINGIECIGLSEQELLEQFEGERYNQYVDL